MWPYLVITWPQHGDSYTEDATEESLREVFKKVEEKVKQQYSEAYFENESVPPISFSAHPFHGYSKETLFALLKRKLLW